MCRIMSDRHWMEYQRGGPYTAPRCSGECFSPIPKPASQYEDISNDPTVFQTDSLPRKGNSDEIDFRYMTSVSNGHLATLVYSPTVYLNGLYNGPTGWSHRARIPSTQALTANISGHPDAKRLYALDVKRGVFEETLTTPTSRVILRLYAHQYYTRLLVSEVTVHRMGDNSDTITVTLANHPGEPSTDINFQPEVDISGEFQNCLSECHYQTGVTLVTESNTTDPRSVHIYNTMVQESVALPAAVTNKTWVFLSSIDMFDEYAKGTFKKALDLLKDDINALYTSHVEAWSKRWARGHIEIDGDTYLSKRIYGSFYYLLSFLPAFDPYIKNNQFYGLSPGGLANGANWTDYQGHVFWDMETWMYPTMLMFHPELAKDMLSYRTYAMGPAYERAAEGGYEGLRFPWESALTGVEQTPDICVPCRENQLHITGDIGLAARQYVTVTRDVDWLQREKGFQMLRDMANFWVTRPTYDKERDTYSINGVMPPDEHAQSINNSAYTNVGAKLSVYFARYAACLAGENATGVVPDSWVDVIDRLFVPFNEEKQYHPEFEGFEDWTDERGVKQADTILLGYPQMWPMTSEVRRNDLVTYEKVTNPLGPAMTWGMFAIGWLELGDEHTAHELFHRSYSPYVREPFKIWTEARSGIGAVNFITGMGGFLQALFFGYGGTRIFTEHMEFDPRVPPGNKALKFIGTNYLGNSLDIEIYTKKVIVITREASTEYPLILRVTGTGAEHWLRQGKEIVIGRVPFSIRTHKVTDCLLPKDEVLRGKNCPHIIARSAWKADNEYATQPTSAAADYVVVDHTAWGMCTDLATCTRAIKHIQDWHQKIGYPDIAYNFLIGEDGRLYEGRGWDVVPGNATDRSQESLSIGLVGVFRCKPANVRIQETLQRLIKCGVELGKINTDYHLVGGTGVEGDMPTVPLAVHCQLRTWKHWVRYILEALGEIFIGRTSGVTIRRGTTVVTCLVMMPRPPFPEG
ncbi:protein-glucosylgalactosylhydroxylysine glucosidase-like [Haliotis asinina]|uniref:protein-glucosylgalactosylhydroxylysine glucosidase-like n=1 Tax=Haliotis asinina TaxID=109174 RepID=UPI0035327ACD